MIALQKETNSNFFGLSMGQQTVKQYDVIRVLVDSPCTRTVLRMQFFIV